MKKSKIQGPGYLKIISPGHPDCILKLEKSDFTVGRDPDNDLQFADVSMSRHHLKFSFDGKDTWVEDLGTNNGTLVNDAAVTKCSLKPNDTICAGRVTMIYLADAELEGTTGLETVSIADLNSSRQNADSVKPTAAADNLRYPTMVFMRPDRNRRGSGKSKAAASAAPKPLRIVQRPSSGKVKATLTSTSVDGEQRFELGTDVFTIGRAPDNILRVMTGTVSEHHARISYQNGAHYVFDLDSTNGIYIDGKKVHHKKIMDGNVIEIGELSLTYNLLNKPEVESAPEPELEQEQDKPPLGARTQKVKLDAAKEPSGTAKTKNAKQSKPQSAKGPQAEDSIPHPGEDASDTASSPALKTRSKAAPAQQKLSIPDKISHPTVRLDRTEKPRGSRAPAKAPIPNKFAALLAMDDTPQKDRSSSDQRFYLESVNLDEELKVELGRDDFKIGRGHQNDLQIKLDDVSQNHVRITYVDGAHVIEDLDSTNGTFVDKERVKTCKLTENCEITVGDLRFVYRLEGGAPR